MPAKQLTLMLVAHMGHPPGRIGVRKFVTQTGISKSSFYSRYRWDDYWIRRLDIRIAPDGSLSFDERAVGQLVKEREGVPATGASPKADQFT